MTRAGVLCGLLSVAVIVTGAAFFVVFENSRQRSGCVKPVHPLEFWQAVAACSERQVSSEESGT